MGIFCPPGSGSADQIESGPDQDPKHCFKKLRVLIFLNFCPSGQHAVHTSTPAKRQVLHEQGRSGAINIEAAVIIFLFQIIHSAQYGSADPLTSKRVMMNQYCLYTT